MAYDDRFRKIEQFTEEECTDFTSSTEEKNHIGRYRKGTGNQTDNGQSITFQEIDADYDIISNIIFHDISFDIIFFEDPQEEVQQHLTTTAKDEEDNECKVTIGS